jgi:hypothetical protein
MSFRKVGHTFVFAFLVPLKYAKSYIKNKYSKTRLFCKFKKFAQMGILSLKKVDIFTLFLVGRNSCLTVDLL